MVVIDANGTLAAIEGFQRRILHGGRQPQTDHTLTSAVVVQAADLVVASHNGGIICNGPRLNAAIPIAQPVHGRGTGLGVV